MSTPFGSMKDIRKQLSAEFKIDHKLIMATAFQKFYQLNPLDAFNCGLEGFGLTPDDDEMPSFNKAAAEPEKAKNFWIGLGQTVWGDPGFLIENFAAQLGITELEPEIVFLPENTLSKNAKSIIRYWNENTGGNVIFVPIIGEKANGFAVSNQTAEAYAKFHMKAFAGKKLVFVCVKLAQRSFSISDINVVHLMYDNGSAAGTSQKGSRAKTSEIGRNDKVAKIISYSLDPKRDDKIDLIFIEEATRLAKKRKKSLKDARSEVLQSMPIFRVGKRGIVSITESEYMRQLDDRSADMAICARIFMTDKLPQYIKELFANLDTAGRLGKISDPEHRFKLGKTRKKQVTEYKKDGKKDAEKALALLIKRLSADGVAVLKLCRYLWTQDNMLTLDELIDKIESDSDAMEWWFRNTDYDFALFKFFVENECWGRDNTYLRNVVEL